METDTVKNDIKRTCVRLLEEWAMMLVDEVPEDTQPFHSETKFFETEIDFHGVFNGKFTIITQDEFALKLVENVIGDESSDEVKKDALCEMANVFAGNLLTTAFGTDLVFDLSSPQCTEKGPEAFDDVTNSSTVFTYLGDDAPVTISFKIQP